METYKDGSIVEKKSLDHIKKIMKRLGFALKIQHKVFPDEWDAKDVEARATMLNTVDDNNFCEFECQDTTKGLWNV